MQLFDVSIVALEKAMAGASLRQELIANNLANVNTPGYRRVDVDFHAALAEALSHGASASQLDALAFAPQTDPTGATRLDGSNVDVDKEMASLSANALDYETLAATLRARLLMLQTVITGR